MPDKYQEEIEEILKELVDSQESTPTDTLDIRDDYSGQTDNLDPDASDDIPIRANTPKITKTKIVLLAMAALLIGGFWFWPLIWIGLILFGIAYIMFFVKPRPKHYAKYWRNKPLEEVRESRWERLTRWFKQ